MSTKLDTLIVVRPSQISRSNTSSAPAFDPFKNPTITNETHLGLYRYPFLGSGKWAIVDVELGRKNTPTILKTVNAASLCWLKDDKVVSIFIPGITDPMQYLESKGLAISMCGGFGKLSKRLSRIHRPFALYAMFESDDIDIRYVKHGQVRAKSQDGAGWVSRRFLKRVVAQRIQDEFVPLLKDESTRESALRSIANLRSMAAHAQRVEYTLMTARGQEKGHALVVETGKFDLRFVEGQTKPEVRMTNSQVFVGFHVVHSSPLFVDRQSYTNLDVNGFFSHDPDSPGENRMARWAKEYLQSSIASVMSGDMTRLLVDQADHLAWEQDYETWTKFGLHEFVARGGDVRWFAATIKQALRIPLKHMQSELDRFAFPIPGRNLYIFPASVAGLNIKRGHCVTDSKNSTLWVNDVDLVTLDPSFQDVRALESWMCRATQDEIAALKPGLSQIFGGCDCDDMFRVVQFTDHDGRKKALCWRSPNKLGEFYVLDWQGGDEFEWADGSKWLKADSRTLPAPETYANTKYLGLVRDYQGDMPKVYSKAAICKLAERLTANKSAIGVYCLALRFQVATMGRLPDVLPATVEEIMDGVAKNFEDASEVTQMVREQAAQLARQSMQEEGKPIPQAFAGEFQNFVGDEVDFVVANPGEHWVDQTFDGVMHVLKWYQSEIDRCAAKATPPAALFESGFKWADAGRRFRSVYAQTMRELLVDDTQEEDDEIREARHDAAREACIAWLRDNFPPEMWPLIMVGGLADRYANTMALDEPEEVGLQAVRDAAFWQLGKRLPDGGREPGIDRLTIEGLTQVGILGELQWDKQHHLTVRLAHDELEDTLILAARGVWFNAAIASGKTNARFMSDIPKAQRDEFKASARKMDLADTLFRIEPVRIVRRGGACKAMGLVSAKNGKLLGTLAQDVDADKLPQTVQVRASHIDDRDVCWLVCKPTS